MFVYVMRNTKNNKVYVGQDSGSVSEMRRVSAHLLDAKKLVEGKSFRSISKIARAHRGQQMKEGRPTRFVLIIGGKDVVIETNLRVLLEKLQTDTPKRRIEKIVRSVGFYHDKEFSIEKRLR